MSATTTATARGKASKQLTQSVLAHANRVHALLTAGGHLDAADRLAAEAKRWDAATTDVVVVGDIKRGKSSLVNALIDRPGLLPVDADVATAVHLVVRQGVPEVVQVTATDPSTGDTSTTTIDPAELATYASMAGDPSKRSGVTAVDVAIDHPLLARGLTLVDTPGVGGMTRGHRDITMAALQRADVLVFVVSIQEPVSRTELEFLAEASERIGNVVIVATRSDLGTDEVNAEMLADTRRRLESLATSNPEAATDSAVARRLARLADRPIVLTSAYLADQARRREERGRHEMAVELRARSGIDVVAERLERAVEGREHLRLANLLQLVSGVLAPLEDEQATKLRAIGGDSTVEDELRARQEQLELAVGQQARWRSTLATNIARLQTGAGREVSRELNLVRDGYRDALEAGGDEADLTALSGQLQQSLQAAWANLADQAARQFDEVITALLDELSIDSEPGLLGELEMPPGIRSMARRGSGSGAGGQFDVLEDGLPLATQTFMFGNIANAVVGVLGVATGGLGLLAYGVGIAMAAPVVMLRRKQRERRKAVGELQRELSESLFGQEGIAREFTTELTLRILDARQQLELLVEERLSARRKELEERRRELQGLLKGEQQTRAAAQKEAERLAGELAGVRRETDQYTAQVDAELEALLTAPVATAASVAAADAAPNPT